MGLPILYTPPIDLCREGIQVIRLPSRSPNLKRSCARDACRQGPTFIQSSWVILFRTAQ
jgi:hypothetical protein